MALSDDRPAPAPASPQGPLAGPLGPAGSGARTSYPRGEPGNGSAPATAPGGGGQGPLDFTGLVRVGIYGGTFDPVHRGHVHVAAVAQAARGLERVVFVPAAQSPHKPGQRLADARDRVAMLELALRGRPDWVVDVEELERPPPSYTIDTLRSVRGRLDPGARLFLVLGSDNLEKFAQWKSAAEILELAEPIVVPREDGLAALRERLRRALPPELAARLERAIVPAPPVPDASSEIRAALAAGSLAPDALPEGVREYIDARGIYGAGRRAPPRE